MSDAERNGWTTLTVLMVAYVILNPQPAIGVEEMIC